MKSIFIGGVLVAGASTASAVSVFSPDNDVQDINTYVANNENNILLNALGIDPTGIFNIEILDINGGVAGQLPGLAATSGTGFVLDGGKYAISVAHIFDSKLPQLNDNDIDEYTLNFSGKNGYTNTIRRAVNGDLSAGGLTGITPHHDYAESGDWVPTGQNAPDDLSFSAFAGYDIAIIDLAAAANDPDFTLSPDIATYSLFQGEAIGKEFVGIGTGGSRDSYESKYYSRRNKILFSKPN